jgi:hypothetical protein
MNKINMNKKVRCPMCTNFLVTDTACPLCGGNKPRDVPAFVAAAFSLRLEEAPLLIGQSVRDLLKEIGWSPNE